MNPTGKKSLLSSFSVGAQSQGNKTSNISSQQRQDTITQRDAAPAPLLVLVIFGDIAIQPPSFSFWF
jgi:hypothetical protein